MANRPFAPTACLPSRRRRLQGQGGLTDEPLQPDEVYASRADEVKSDGRAKRAATTTTHVNQRFFVRSGKRWDDLTPAEASRRIRTLLKLGQVEKILGEDTEEGIEDS